MKTSIPSLLLAIGLWPLWTGVVGAREAGSIMDAVKELPKCATTCVLSAIPDSSCGLTNTTCICQDAKFETATEACIRRSCSIVDTLHSKNLFETTCGRPVRDRSAEYARVTWAMIGLSSLIVAARLIYKSFSMVSLGLDDLFCLLAFLAVIPSYVINLIGLIPSGLGKDIWTLTPNQIDMFGFWFYILEPMYFVQMGLVKMTILSFYLRVFDRAGLGRLLWGTVAFNAVNTVAFVLAAVFQCTPIPYYWKRWDGMHQGSCNNINALPWANAIVSILMDLWMLGLPLFKIKALNLHWWKKMAAGLMFCVGTFVTIISVLRLHSLVLFAKTDNPTWDQYGLALWTTLEVPIGIICSCLPAIRQILIKTLPNCFGRLTKYYGAGRYASAISDPNSRNPTRDRKSIGPLGDNSAPEWGAGTRRSRGAFGRWDIISVAGDTSQLYDLRDLEASGDDKDDKDTLRQHESTTPASSVIQHPSGDK